MLSFSHSLFLLFLLFGKTLAQNPTCSIDSSAFSTVTPPQPQNGYILSPTQEVIDGISYGATISIASRIWLAQKPFSLAAGYLSLKDPCPLGWMLPTDQDLKNLVAAVGSNVAGILFNPSLFNFLTTRYYLSSTKTYPNSTNPSLAQSWTFNGLKFLTTGVAQVVPINTYFMSTLISAVCVRRRANETTTPGMSGISLKGIDKRDLVKGLKYVLGINNTNILDNTWTIDSIQNNSNYLSIIPMKEGLFTLNYKVMMYDGSVIGDCRLLWVRNYTGSEANTNLTLDSIKAVRYPFPKYRNIGLHFNSGSAPLAPKEEGGAYIMYAERLTQWLHILSIDNDGNQISDFNLTVSGYAFDLISVGWGCVALIKDFKKPDLLYLLGVNSNNQTVFNRTIMNPNSDSPTNYTSDQLIFYKDVNGTPNFGMNAMFDPSSGALEFGKNRIAVIFAHYNFFGYLSDGTRNDHTGDTLFTVDTFGKNEKIAFSWGTSHSLEEELFYNGDKFISAALGDAYPMNIFFSTVDGLNAISTPDPYTKLYNILDSQKKSNLLPDIMPGNGAGFSNGRLGSIIQLADGQRFVVSYARRRSWTFFQGKNYSSQLDEVGLAYFDKNLTLIKDVSLGSGQWVDQIQSCRYGRNIFVSYVISNQTVLNGMFLDGKLNSDDVQYYLLVDEDGNLLNGPFKNTGNSTLPASDKMKMMADGRCAWTYVDFNGLLNFMYLTKPEQTPTGEDTAKSSIFYHAESFYMINQFDSNYYRMASIEQSSVTFVSLFEERKDEVLASLGESKLRVMDGKKKLRKRRG